MKATKKTRIPSLRHCNNRGFVCLNGKRIYLGTWGEASTQDAYERTRKVKKLDRSENDLSN